MNHDFLTLYSGLERLGPGRPADVHWALDIAGTPNWARVLDAGAGSGADTVTLARTLTEARIQSVEAIDVFTDTARVGTAEFTPRVTVWCGDMFSLPGPFDLIWSAGAAYFRGVSEALRAWAPALASGGRIAFSEIVWLTADPPGPVATFWGAYEAMTDLPGTRDRISHAGFRILGERMLDESAWDAYYHPLEARIATLREGEVGPGLAEVLDDASIEISLRREYGDHYGYCLFVVSPT